MSFFTPNGRTMNARMASSTVDERPEVLDLHRLANLPGTSRQLGVAMVPQPGWTIYLRRTNAHLRMLSTRHRPRPLHGLRRGQAERRLRLAGEPAGAGL